MRVLSIAQRYGSCFYETTVGNFNKIIFLKSICYFNVNRAIAKKPVKTKLFY